MSQAKKQKVDLDTTCVNTVSKAGGIEPETEGETDSEREREREGGKRERASANSTFEWRGGHGATRARAALG